MQKSIRGNSLPAGGVASTSQGGQSQQFLPDTLTLKRLSEAFMAKSEYNSIQMNPVFLLPGGQINFQINNIGLGESLDLYISGEISLVNTKAGTQDVEVSPEFPFNLISNILTQFNGQTVINSLSGYELLAINAKRHKSTFISAGASEGSRFTQAKQRVDRAIAYVEAGANLTVTKGDALCGVSKVTIEASKTGVLKFGCYLNLPYTLRSDLLLGLIPMQNNNIYCNVSISTPTLLGTTPASPLFVSNAIPATLSADSGSLKVEPTFNIWSIPQPNDASIYSYLVAHSYMLLSTANNVVSKTGGAALQHNIPNNFLLLAMLFTMRDSSGKLIDIPAKINNPYLSYNNTARVDRRDINSRFARQLMYYEQIPGGLGQLLWDGTDVEYQPNGTNTTKWLNMYLANNPQFVADLAEDLALPVSFSAMREQLVAAAVQII